MKQGRNVRNISHVMHAHKHNMGDMPTPFLFTNSCITAHSIAAKLNGIN